MRAEFRPSKFDLRAVENYARLAFKSSCDDQEYAHVVVKRINELEAREDRIEGFAQALMDRMAEVAR